MEPAFFFVREVLNGILEAAKTIEGAADLISTPDYAADKYWECGQECAEGWADGSEVKTTIIAAAKHLLTQYIKSYFAGRTVDEMYGKVGKELSDKRMFSFPDRKMKERPSINTCSESISTDSGWTKFQDYVQEDEGRS